jgi:predicted amidophosphoribosyltransferase
MGMPAGETMKSCIWKCGPQTRNKTGICDACWRDRDRIYLERKQREAAEGKIQTGLQAENARG